MTPVLLSLALAVGAPQAKDKPKAEPSLVGEWELESRTLGGAPILPFALAGRIRYTFKAAGECVITVGTGVPPTRYTFLHDPKADPPTFAFLQGAAGPVVEGIYKVDGDTLTLCWDCKPKAAPPTAFVSPTGSQVVLNGFKRVKAKD
ncbi:MAG TPA: TIGR03067 domain-containing protein [Gemmataceae bacterium]|nr:TIGR03067 domain-containing protein [Gemmataceae bacterium]